MIELLPSEKIESLNIKDYKIIQSDDLYKFTSDPVLLSRFARAGATKVCDLCAGSGIVSLHYYALNDLTVKKVVAVEIQKELAQMNEKSVRINGLQDVFTVINAPLQDYKTDEKFDLVLCNPPYEKRGAGLPPKSEHLAVCRTEKCVTLDEIVAAASGLLDKNGYFCVCHKVSRLPEVFSAFERHSLCPSRLQLVSGRSCKAYLALIEGVKGKKVEIEAYSTVINDFIDFSGEKRN